MMERSRLPVPRRGFLRTVLGAAFTSAALLEQAVFRAARARAQARYALPVVFDLEKVAEGVYAAVARPQALTNSNAVIFENAEDLLIVDAHSKPSAVASLVRQLRTDVTEKPVRYIVATHFHWDHAQGLAAYRRLAPRADIVASETTRRLISREAAPRLKQSLAELEKSLDGLKKKVAEAKDAATKAAWEQMLTETRDYLSEMKAFAPELPNLTLDRELILHDKAHDLHLGFHGRGHTSGDIVVWCPHKRVLAAGDLVHSFFPFLGDGYPREWPRTMVALGQLDFQTVAGGHGAPQAGKDRLYQMRDFIEELTEEVSRRMGEGQRRAQVEAGIAPNTLRSLAGGGYADFLARNILKYRFLPPPIPDAARVVAEGVRACAGQIFERLEAVA